MTDPVVEPEQSRTRLDRLVTSGMRQSIETLASRLVPAAAAIVAIVVGVAVGGPLLNRAPAAPESETVVSGLTPDPGEITVHVGGMVVSPGLIALPAGARVADAISAAGGFAPGAGLAGLNLARPLVDGELVQVGALGDEPVVGTEDGLLRLNVADAGELEGLPGVGPVLAQRILQYREKNGPFSEVEDLLSVPGIGASKLEAIRPLVQVP